MGGADCASECKKHLENDQKNRNEKFSKCSFMTQDTDGQDDRQTRREQSVRSGDPPQAAWNGLDSNSLPHTRDAVHEQRHKA